MAKTILVIDDEPHVLMVLRVRLRSVGYQVITAVDGVEGLEKARSERPDLIVVDLMLPKLNGWRLCQAIKEDIQYAHIPIIVCSALVAASRPTEAVELGDAYLEKPFKGETLLLKVKELLQDT